MFTTLTTENYSQSFAIYDLVKEQANDVEQGELIYSHTRFELGASYQGLGIAYLQRLDAVVLHSFDAALIYYYDKRDTLDIPNRDYNYALKVNTVESQGATFFYEYRPIDNFLIKLNVDVATTDFHYDGLVDGVITYQQEELVATADLEWTYERDVLFDRDVIPAKGELLASSVVLGGASEYGQHQLTVADFYHKVKWERVPYTKVRANTDRVGGFTDDGKLKIRPLGSGVDGFRDVEQTFEPRYYFYNDLDLPVGGILLNIDYVADQWWPQLGYRFPLGSQSHVAKVAYSFEDDSLELSYAYKRNFSLSVRLDETSYQKAHRFNLGLSLRLFEF